MASAQKQQASKEVTRLFAIAMSVATLAGCASDNTIVLHEIGKRSFVKDPETGKVKLDGNGNPVYGPVEGTGAYAEADPLLSTQTILDRDGRMYEKSGGMRSAVEAGINGAAALGNLAQGAGNIMNGAAALKPASTPAASTAPVINIDNSSAGGAGGTAKSTGGAGGASTATSTGGNADAHASAMQNQNQTQQQQQKQGQNQQLQNTSTPTPPANDCGCGTTTWGGKPVSWQLNNYGLNLG